MKNECVGILGRVFGHKFTRLTDARWDYCRRCGKRVHR